MSPPSVKRIFSGNSSSLRTASKRFVLCMHILRFTQSFQLRIPKTLPFLLLPNVNLNPDFQERITLGRFQTILTCISNSNAQTTLVSFSRSPSARMTRCVGRHIALLSIVLLVERGGLRIPPSTLHVCGGVKGTRRSTLSRSPASRRKHRMNQCSLPPDDERAT
jgi:hypothetical protein